MELVEVGKCWKWLECVGNSGCMDGSTQERRLSKAMLQHLFSATNPRKNGGRPNVLGNWWSGCGNYKEVTSGFRFPIWIIEKYGKIVFLNTTQPSILAMFNDFKPLPYLLTSSDPRPRPFLNLAETWQDKGGECIRMRRFWCVEHQTDIDLDQFCSIFVRTCCPFRVEETVANLQ